MMQRSPACRCRRREPRVLGADQRGQDDGGGAADAEADRGDEAQGHLHPALRVRRQRENVQPTGE